MTQKLPRIFVQIASYRDSECQWTVRDLFEKAAHPERITVGICWQYMPGEDDDIHPGNIRPDQVRIMEALATESLGLCWARNETQKLWQGEEYTFVTDSHMRFIEGWDDAMIEQLLACPSKKPFLSCNPASYVPPHNLELNAQPTVRLAGFFNNKGEMKCRWGKMTVAPDAPVNGAFVAGGYMFSSTDVMKEVPYDPYLYFNQEEVTYAARIWTHGWDIFQPSKVIAYHYYVTDDNRAEKKMHWRDNDTWVKLQQVARARYQHLFGQAPSTDPDVLKELDLYGMGTERSLEDYQHYCGLDYKNMKVTERALRGGFIEGLEKWKPRKMYVKELDANPKDAAAMAQLVSEEAFPAITWQQVKEMKEKLVEKKGENATPGQGGPSAAKSAVTIARGDFLPFISLNGHDGKLRHINNFSGKPLLMFILPPKQELWNQLYSNFKPLRDDAAEQGVSVVFIVAPGLGDMKTLRTQAGIQEPLWVDEDGGVIAAFGLALESGNHMVPTAIMTTPNLKVRQVIREDNAQFNLDEMIELASLLAVEAGALTPQAPVLIVPEVLSPELCAQLIEEWRAGDKKEGIVGNNVNNGAYRPDMKVRTEVMLSGSLLELVDATIIRTLLPEIEKVYDLRIAYRERYKLGCYEAEKGGFFSVHRDRSSVNLGYRRVSMVINLNDQYEGGELNFPEYGTYTYRLKPGSAIVFPAMLMHQVGKVTKGQRFMMVSFFHTANEEPSRLEQRKKEGLAPNVKDYSFMVPHEPYGGIAYRDGNSE